MYSQSAVVRTRPPSAHSTHDILNVRLHPRSAAFLRWYTHKSNNIYDNCTSLLVYTFVVVVGVWLTVGIKISWVSLQWLISLGLAKSLVFSSSAAKWQNKHEMNTPISHSQQHFYWKTNVKQRIYYSIDDYFSVSWFRFTPPHQNEIKHLISYWFYFSF